MSIPEPPFCRIVRPAAAQRGPEPAEARVRRAAACLLGPEHAAAVDRLLEHLRRTSVPLTHLWAVEDARGTTIAAALALPGAGRSAQILASRPSDASSVPAVAAAIDAAVTALDPAEATLAQALLEEEAIDGGPMAPLRQAYERAGFVRLAVLDSMSRLLPRRGRLAAPSLPPAFAVAPWDGDERAMTGLLESTYEGTLDCPGLLGLRRSADILAGHRASGRFDPRLWLLLHREGAPVGAALLNPSHSGEEIELVYFGLAAAQRGRGLGRLLLGHALARIAGRRERRICLAVDRANAPALALYRAHGFQATGSRLAMIRPLNVKS